MANGIFLGGVAEGMRSAESAGLKRDALAQELGLKTRGLDLQEQGLSLREKGMEQELGLRTRALKIQEQGQRNAQSRFDLSQADKAVADTMSVVTETITNALASGREPAQVAKAIRPLVESAKRIAAKAGRDPSDIDVQVNAMMAQPTVTEKATGKAKAGVAAARAVSEETGVSEREALQGQGVLRAEPRNASTIEGIRSKIAAGESLTAGEQRVYDDALRSDPLARFLALQQGANAAGQTNTPAAPAASATPAASTATQPVPEAFKNDPDGTAYMKGDARWVKQGDKLVKQ